MLHDTDQNLADHRKNEQFTSARIGDGIDRMPPLVVVTAAAVRMVSRIGGALFPQNLDRLAQFVQLVILNGR